MIHVLINKQGGCMECPKCQYVRVSTDTAPDYECPKCGIIYAKFDPSVLERQAALRAKIAPRRVERKAEPIAAPALAAVVSDSIQNAPAKPIETSDPGVEVIPGNVAVCKNCEEIGQVKDILPGSGWVELALFLLIFVPGVIYSVWRRKGTKQVCSACGSDQLVAAKTRLGKQIIANQFDSFKIGVDDTSSFKFKPPTFGKTTSILLWVFAACFVAVGISFLFMADTGFMLTVINFAWAALFALGAYKTGQAKPVRITVGLGLVGR
jgi:ssDNA-binding Zn-finger/Zn-ribbon topoisomerase 1